jgi:TM2 domain-containing membrane protein YozV
MSINFVNFFWQCVALTVWVGLAAGVYIVFERIVSQLDGRKQTLLAAYLLWAAMGLFGAHRIYCGRIMSGLAQFALSACLLLLGLAIEFYVIIPAALWVLADAFLIPGWVRSEEAQGAAQPGPATGQA